MKRVIAWALILVVCLGLFAGCKKNQSEPTEGVNVVDTAALEAALEYIKTVYKNASEKTPQDFQRIGNVPVNGVDHEIAWTVDVGEEFVKVVRGEDGMVTIDVNENVTEDVPYALTATISDDYGNSVSHSWNHLLPASNGDMVAIVEAAYALKPGESMDYEVTLTGIITAINTPWSDDYQNITVTIEVAGAEDKPIQCYRLKGDGAKDLKIGDTITVTGTLKNYNGTIEFDAGCTLDAVIPGEAIEAPDDPKKIVDEAYKLGANKSLPYEVTLTGTITEVGTPYDANYKNITVTIVVEGREKKPIVCYRMKGEGADKIGVNDIITVKGYITNYVGSKGYSTIEFTAGCQLISWVDKAAPKAPSDPKKIVDAAYALGANETLKYEATLTGRITKVGTAYDPGFKNVTVTMVVDGREDKPIVCYRMKGKGADQIGIGDIITVKGFITNYVGDKGYSTIEFNYPTLVSYKKNTTKAPTDFVAIVKAAYALKPGEQLPYQATLTGKITKVNTEYDPSYKNVTVTIVVEGAEDMPIKCYRLKGVNADKIGVGDTITVTGYIENYKHSSGDTEVEFTAGCTLDHWDDTGANVEPKPETPITNAALLVEKPVNGDTIVIYNSGNAMASEANGSKMGKVAATVSNYILPVTPSMAQVKVTVSGEHYIFTVNGKYLTSAASGNGMSLQRNLTDCAKWTLESAGTGKWYIKNVGANYNGNYNQAMEYYSGFTTYGLYAGDSKYMMELYKIGGNAPDIAPEVPAEINYGPLKQNTAYNMKMVQGGVGKTVYLSGTMDGDYLATTENVAAASTVYVEKVEGQGVRFYTLNGTTKTYVEIYLNTSGKSRPALNNTASVVWTYNEEAGVYTVKLEGTEYYLGTYSTYTTISASGVFYITGSNAGNKGVTQFYVECVEVGGTTPEPSEPSTEPSEPSTEPSEPSTEPSEPADPIYGPLQEGTAYAMQLIQVTAGKTVYLNGKMSGEYLASTENTANAVMVYVEKIEDEGVRFYIMDPAKTYVEIYLNDSSKPRPTLSETANVVWTYNEEAGVYTVELEGTEYYLGSYSDFTTFSASSVSYITGENAANKGVTQFVVEYVLHDELPEPAPTPGVTQEAVLLTEKPVSGDLVIIYNSENAMGATASGSKVAGVAATVTDGALGVTDAMAQLEVTVDGENYIFTLDGKYLTSGATGNSLSFAEELTDCGKWTLESAGTGLWYIKNVGANYNGNYNQALEYYSGFTTYGIKETEIYQMQLFKAPEPTPTATLLTEKPAHGDLVIIYNSENAMGAAASGNKLAGVSAAVTDGVMPIAEEMAQLQVTVDGENYIFTLDGKYLTSGATGNSLSFAEELTDCGKWTLESAGTGLWYIKNVGANYNGNYNQALEYYSGFTTYGIKETEIYQMQLFKAGVATDAPAPTPTPTPTPDPDPEPTPDPEPVTGSYVKVTALDQLTTGKYVLVAGNGYAPGIYDNGWVTAVQPTVAGDQVTNANGGEWTITVDGTSIKLTDANGVTVAPKGGNNNGITDGDYSWAVTFANGAFQFAGVDDDTVILASNTGSENKFRAYKTTTVSGNPNGYPSEFTLYKLVEE